MFKFEILKKSKKSKARLGLLKTPNGHILTPAFLPVATMGVIRGGLSREEFLSTGAQAQITNSFHFLDLNYVNIVKKAGGLHKFLNFPKPIFTDSGGFQVFSLGRGNEYGLGKISSIFPEKTNWQNNKAILRSNLIKKINEEGVLFLSPRDGRKIFLTPELSAQIQKNLGADFIYVLDVCGTPLDSYNRTKKELEISHNWFLRFLKQKIDNKQRVFGIIQGGLFDDLRLKSTEFVNNLPVFGIAIGGALGKSKKDMYKILNLINKKIDPSRPHHLLGIGSPNDLEKIIEQGIDLFDCVLPSRMARHGMALTKKGFIDISKSKFQREFKVIERGCKCLTCQNYTISQLNFLFRAKEILGGKLLTIHNLFYFEQLLSKIREKMERNKI